MCKRITVMHNLLENRVNKKKILNNSLYEIRITLILEPDKGLIGKESYRSISHRDIKVINKTLPNQIQQHTQ